MCGCPKYPRPQAISEMMAEVVMPVKASLKLGLIAPIRATDSSQPPTAAIAAIGTTSRAMNIMMP